MPGDYKGLIAVAVGAGLMISSAGLFVYQIYFGERKRLSLQQEISQLETCVSEIRRELNALRIAVERNHLIMAHRAGKQDTGAPSYTTDAETEMFSTIDADDPLDEFYEFSSDTELAGEEPDTTTTFGQIDELLENTSKEDTTKAYGLLLELLEKGESDELLWRLSKACHKMSSIYAAEGDDVKKQEYIFKGAEYGQKAVALNASNWNSHKWYAICVGKRSQLLRVKEKIQDGYVFKEHLDKALELNAEDPLLHHLLGRFNYELSSLSWFEKKVASTLFGNVPHGTYEKALTSLLEVERLATSPWKENRLLIAKCYAAQKDTKKTLEWLNSAKEVPSKSAEDKLADNEIEKLLQTLEKEQN